MYSVGYVEIELAFRSVIKYELLLYYLDLSTSDVKYTKKMIHDVNNI